MNKPTVLAVDDSSDDVTLLTFACQAAKVCFDLQTAESGDEAISYLSGSPPFTDRLKYPEPDLVLLDIKMPGKSGFEVLSWIRSRQEFANLPVVVFSASMHDGDRAEALRLGANDYVVKPVTYQILQEFTRKIEQLLTVESKPPIRTGVTTPG